LLRAGVPSQPASRAASQTATATPFRAPAPGQLAPHFPQLEVLELIGQGGMGAVYKARQPALDRFVALKILRPRGDGDPAFAERFAREARALARLSHPHIVGVHDFGEAGGFHFLLMEFVDGTSLRQAMQAGRMTPREALAIVPPLCEALQYAHDRGIVHRDIKPENILLTREGVVKVADFGLAKLVAPAGAAADATLTGIGDVMGTPHYMAPEQVEHPQDVDHRADIYSLGVVFYQMLTGELPLGRFAPPSHRVQVDVRLDEIVLRTLEKEPERRYQQASEVKTEVETIAAGVAPPQQQASVRDTTEEDLRCAELVRLPATLLMGFFALGLLSVLPMGIVFIGDFAPAVAGKLGTAEAGLMTAMLLVTVAGIALAGVGSWAAHRSRRLCNHRHALLAAIGGIVAFPFLNLIGLLTAAAGVWLLVVLMRADVQAAFRRNPGGVPYDPKRSRATRSAWFILLGLVVLTLSLASLAIPVLLRRGSVRTGEGVKTGPVSAASAVDRPAEYVALVQSLVARHPADELEMCLASARDALALEQARCQAGLSEAMRVAEAQAEVDFLTAEKAGGTDKELIEIRLQLARRKVALLDARRHAGMVDTSELEDARDEAAVLEALLGEDVVAPFRILANQRSRQHTLVRARYVAGLATNAEMAEAKRRLDLAFDRLGRVETPARLEAIRRSGAAAGPEAASD
jgi:predicted Ser/Thr protein kinase